MSRSQKHLQPGSPRANDISRKAKAHVWSRALWWACEFLPTMPCHRASLSCTSEAPPPVAFHITSQRCSQQRENRRHGGYKKGPASLPDFWAVTHSRQLNSEVPKPHADARKRFRGAWRWLRSACEPLGCVSQSSEICHNFARLDLRSLTQTQEGGRLWSSLPRLSSAARRLRQAKAKMGQHAPSEQRDMQRRLVSFMPAGKGAKSAPLAYLQAPVASLFDLSRGLSTSDTLTHLLHPLGRGPFKCMLFVPFSE